MPSKVARGKEESKTLENGRLLALEMGKEYARLLALEMGKEYVRLLALEMGRNKLDCWLWRWGRRSQLRNADIIRELGR